MLTRLCINNLAIIENVDVSFKDGFTVLTGGTGAGKSLVIDSLSLLLGDRASTELIRQGEDKATIRGYFLVESNRLSALLNKLEIPFIDNEIVVERVISRSKSTIKVNGVTVALTDLNRLAKHLADIHSQFDFAKILNPDNYLDIIDGFAFESLSKLKADYAKTLEEYRSAKEEHARLLAKKASIEASRDFYEFQLKELTDAALSLDEEAQIETEIALLGNYDKVYSLFQEADRLAHSDILDQLYELNKVLARIASYQPQYQEIQEKIDDRYFELDGLLSDIKKDFRNLDYDPERLNVLQQRSADLAALKRKYRKSIPELISYREELASLVGSDGNIDSLIEEKAHAMEELRKLCLSKGTEISLLRKRVAKTIEKDIKQSLERLLLRSEFEIRFNEIDEASGDAIFKPAGIDEVDFLIETNVGEGLKSLSKIASGGEASRIMLAFKIIFVKANKVATVIFDEIDTGLSGEAASAVAREIAELSLSCQVLAITHMPQVASLSDHHILIRKEVSAGRTYTRIQELGLEEKIREVAYLISGGKITQKQLDYAREMVLGAKD